MRHFGWLALTLIGGFCVAYAAPARHGLSVEDVMGMQDIGHAIVTPDGRSLIFEWLGPYSKLPNNSALWSTADRRSQARIFIVDLDGHDAPHPLFSQRKDGGYWLANLSIGGSRLAVYSLVDGHVGASTIDLGSGERTVLPVEPECCGRFSAPLWVSDRSLVYVVDGSRYSPRSVRGRRGLANEIESLWARNFNDGQPTVTVSVSGPPGASRERTIQSSGESEGERLVQVDVRSGAAREIARGDFEALSPSPDRRLLAALQNVGSIQLPPGQRIGDEPLRASRLVILDLDHLGTVKWACSDCTVVPYSLVWSSDSRYVSYLAYGLGQSATHAELRRLDPQSGKELVLNSRGFEFACGTFLGSSHPARIPLAALGDDVLAFGRIARDSKVRMLPSVSTCLERRHQRKRQDYGWALLREGSTPSDIVGAPRTSSAGVIAIGTEGDYVLAGGEVWFVEAGGRARKLVSPYNSGLKVRDWEGSPGRGVVPMSVHDGVTHILLESDGAAITLQVPAEQFTRVRGPLGSLVASDNQGRVAVFRRDTPSGSVVSSVTASGGEAELFSFNRLLEHVALGKQIELTYTVSGIRTSSCILLPPGWTRGTSNPTIVIAYPGVPRWEIPRGQCFSADTKSVLPFNTQLLSGHGYVVLFPATPAEDRPIGKGFWGGSTQWVMSGISAATKEGYADPARLGLLGWSQGMHQALQILEETRRFKAGMVAVGLADFGSAYSASGVYSRLDREQYLVPQAQRFEMSADLQNNGLNAKPWESPLAYVDNSPVYFADRVSTPLLIMNGDLDGFGGLDQASEMFGALYRLQKEAVYVTYWGEGHMNVSPANVRDAWARIFSWFDGHLSPSQCRGDSRHVGQCAH